MLFQTSSPSSYLYRAYSISIQTQSVLIKDGGYTPTPSIAIEIKRAAAKGMEESVDIVITQATIDQAAHQSIRVAPDKRYRPLSQSNNHSSQEEEDKRFILPLSNNDLGLDITVFMDLLITSAWQWQESLQAGKITSVELATVFPGRPVPRL